MAWAARSGDPSEGGDWLEDEAGKWSKAGVEVVVSLLENDEAHQLDLDREKDAMESTGLRFLSFPIPDRGVPESTRDAKLLLTEIARSLNEGRSVAIHCRQGVGRSGMIAAAVLVGAEIEPAEAIRAVSAARGNEIPETASQRRWIERLRSERLAQAG